MQTRTYGDLFKLIQSLAGVNSFATTETDDIANLINRRYFEAYQTIQMWPRYLVESEERILSSFLVSGYSTADYNGLFYKLGEDSSGNPVYVRPQKNPTGGSRSGAAYNLNNSDKTWLFSGGSWVKDVDTGVVSFTGSVVLNTQTDTSIQYDNPWDVVWSSAESGLPQLKKVQTVGYDELVPGYSSSDAAVDMETISEFIRIHRQDAFLNNSAREYDFFINDEGANILNVANSEDTSVFVTYKKKFTPFTTSENFTTSTEEVPSEFFHYIAHSAYSDFLRMDGQHDKAQLEQENAQQYLALELERVDVIMNQTTVNKRFSTHVNRQSR